jgi:biotin carboxyl carrier protein
VYTAAVSSKEWIAIIGDQEHEARVTVDPNGRSLTFQRGDESLVVDAAEIRPGSYSILLNGRSLVIDLERRGDQLVASSAGFRASVRLDDARRRRLAAAMGDGGQDVLGEVIKAPIAGKVIKLFVEVGESVEVGARIVVLEAMKMENEIKAGRGGVIESIHVEPGQSVETQEKLVTIVAG